MPYLFPSKHLVLLKPTKFYNILCQVVGSDEDNVILFHEKIRSVSPLLLSFSTDTFGNLFFYWCGLLLFCSYGSCRQDSRIPQVNFFTPVVSGYVWPFFFTSKWGGFTLSEPAIGCSVFYGSMGYILFSICVLFKYTILAVCYSQLHIIMCFFL